MVNKTDPGVDPERLVRGGSLSRQPDLLEGRRVRMVGGRGRRQVRRPQERHARARAVLSHRAAAAAAVTVSNQHNNNMHFIDVRYSYTHTCTFYSI